MIRRDPHDRPDLPRRVNEIEKRVRTLELQGFGATGDATGAWAHVFSSTFYADAGNYWPQWTFFETGTPGWDLIAQPVVPGVDLALRAPATGIYAWSMGYKFQIEWEGEDPVGTLPYWFSPVLYPYDGFNLAFAGAKNNGEWDVVAGGDISPPVPVQSYTAGNTRAEWHWRYAAEVISVPGDAFQGNGDGRTLALNIRPFKFWTADWQEWTATFLWPDTGGNTNRNLLGSSADLLVYQIADLAAIGGASA